MKAGSSQVTTPQTNLAGAIAPSVFMNSSMCFHLEKYRGHCMSPTRSGAFTFTLSKSGHI
jgi:hypothetical protein